MPETFVTGFDESTSSPGLYYVPGDLVVHGPHQQVCLVTAVRRVRGTRMNAYLEVVDAPTEEQKSRALTWQKRSLGFRD